MSEFKETIDSLVTQMVETDGKWGLPDAVAQDLDEPTLFAVTAERRVRDTQSAYTKAQQEAKRQEAIATGLQEHVLAQGGTMTSEQVRELHDLKKTDPDAWRTKLNEYEIASKTTLEATLATIRTESSATSEVEVRKEQMAAWSDATGLTLTEEVVKKDLPPRFMASLESGEINFDQFLTQAGEFLKAEKVIRGADDDTENPKNLGDLPGGPTPSQEAVEGSFDTTYEKTMF